ncbi:MAG: prepilin-type N-terminal cleavage/methylation domain-containing protein [Candidatus Sumerlaeia bacterium]|nr:prepilin-type N-terminal cleavage/methylation domain-containing protein [Candidatus Sumerlaeia bacterium]
MKRQAGFTLIELLIVVAIIAILAAIAVPNFLEAQVRSKVSRCKADMRTVVTAMEAYGVDYNVYPPAVDYGRTPVTPVGACFHARLPTYLTTPIAYTTSIFLDPFVSQDSTFSNACYPVESQVGKRYAYFNWDWYLKQSAGGKQPEPAGLDDFWTRPKEWTGAWLIYGYGPDKTAFHGAGATFLPYDPTNGTVSNGNIVRCQKNQDGIPPHPVTGTFNWP